jgi:TetR/AcrR family transcriptional regulator, regulator of cefoperazone and chloramphenicol sensitivity
VIENFDMSITKKSTKQRLIEAACEVFSKKGYHEATIAEICAHSHCNIAAVNYHFGDKESLYAHAWRYAFDESLKVYPPEGTLTEADPANERLKARISSLLSRILDEGKVGYFSRMLLSEMATPTNTMDTVIEQTVIPQREMISGILAKLLGEAATEENIRLCGMCIVNMCSMFSMNSHLREKIFNSDKEVSITKDLLIDHIYTFTMGGIKECREQYLRKHCDA